MNEVFLDDKTFKEVIAHAPLFAIDLVVEDESGHLLLGLRRNRPAQGYWFVPGGRVRKNERLDEAFCRLTRDELGSVFSRSEARLLDVYEHLYPDSVFGETPNTHYVVAAYHLRVKRALLDLPVDQHSAFRWWTKLAICSAAEVHENSRAYLDKLV